MENWLTTYGDTIDGVIGENDEMAIGASQAIVQQDLVFGETFKLPCCQVECRSVFAILVQVLDLGLQVFKGQQFHAHPCVSLFLS